MVFGVPNLFTAVARAACRAPSSDPAKRAATAASPAVAMRSFEFMGVS
jgi:hypothetical protein